MFKLTIITKVKKGIWIPPAIAKREFDEREFWACDDKVMILHTLMEYYLREGVG